jgi:tetratricopeptide (TPR) repeat protein
MEVFRNARQTLRLLVEESQGDIEALFELSQVEYWIGQVHLDWGQMEAADESFRTYSDLSIELNRLHPDNADWTMEVAYAQSNLGNLESRKIPSDPQKVLEYHQKALEFNEKAALLDTRYERDMAQSHAYLADAWLGVCNLEQAINNRQKNVELAAKYYHLDPSSNRLKLFYAYALVGLSRIQQDSGRLETAMATMQRALQIQNELVEEDPNNSFKRWNLVRSYVFQARFLEMAGKEDESWDRSQAILATIRELAEQDQEIRIDYAIVYGMFLRDLANRAFLRGDVPLAERLMRESIDRLTAIANKRPDSLNALNELALTYFSYWDHHQSELPDDSADTWLTRVSKVSNYSSCIELDIASRQAVMAGESEQARQYVSSLTGRGYQETGFMRFCVKYELCPALR